MPQATCKLFRNVRFFKGMKGGWRVVIFAPPELTYKLKPCHEERCHVWRYGNVGYDGTDMPEYVRKGYYKEISKDEAQKLISVPLLRFKDADEDL